jgi:glycosyltransferase involved in cell wall biosynthesis
MPLPVRSATVAPPRDGFGARDDTRRRAEAGARLRGLATRWILRGGMRTYLVVLRIVQRVGPSVRRADSAPQDVLLTLNFHAPGWPRALLGPLAASRRCGRLRIVTTAAVSGLDAVEVIQPPAWLRAVCGSTIARLVTFAWVAARSRPHVVGGVHLLFNGLAASLVARAIGARSLYVCVGGPNEVAGGGLWSENRAFALLPGPDPTIERQLIAAAQSFDRIVTMGTRAADYFRSQGITTPAHVIPSGVDGSVYRPGAGARDVDVILVARLAPVKRVDLFVETIRRVSEALPSIHAVIIGKGPMREASEALARQLGIAKNVTFLGHEPDVSAWLGRAKVFLLTSDTEGLSISLIEAMLSGAVPVVSAVGDLADAIEPGVNGFLVSDRTPAGFSAPIIELLTQPERCSRLSVAAREAATRYDPEAIGRKWDAVLGADELDSRVNS